MNRVLMANTGFKHAAGNGGDSILFPYLMLFLCVLGVLALLQILLSLTMDTIIEAHISNKPDDHRRLYRYLCYAEGVVALPPEDDLSHLRPDLATSAPELARIIDRRQRLRHFQQRRGDQPGQWIRPFRTLEIDQQLRDILALNRLARLEGIDYEEVVMLGVIPGGGDHCHKLRHFWDDADFAAIGVTYEPLDTHWSLQP